MNGFEQIDFYTESKIPYFFMIDFLKENCIVKTIKELDNQKDISFEINHNFYQLQPKIQKKIQLKRFPQSIKNYQKSFDKVYKNIHFGNSYLCNLTCETEIEINLSLAEIYHQSKAKYKLLYNNKFVCFSPENFIKIKDNQIVTFPMKGTINAEIFDAENQILNDEKEKAEHYTIVDLLRNDVSMVAENVEVKRFRYIDELQTESGKILQVSSEISGTLLPEFQQKFGTILEKLLPAGSICGAPKEKTLEIILENETHNRNFYTGIFGFFDGNELDCAVMIRFIEQRNGKMYYKSGGGITHLSEMESEYQEMLQKIYVPIF